MKLFYSPPSPFARKVLVTLIETKQIDDVELVQVKVGPLDPGEIVPSFNPLGKIPTLILPGGEPLIDSKLICRYFADKKNRPYDIELYPPGTDLWPVLNLEALADGIMDAAILLVYEKRIREKEFRVKSWVDAQRLKITRTLNFLEAQQTTFSKDLNIGSLTICIALDYLDFRHADMEWRLNCPYLADWHLEIKNRKSLASTMPHD
mgnify:CR=1 FL=1